MTATGRSSIRLAYAAWIAVCLLWGTTFFGIRVSLETMPPALMGGLRWTLAGALLSAYVLATGRGLPRVRDWGPIALLGFLMLGLGNGGVVFAEQWIPSGLAAVLVASAPFWMVGVEACLPDGERLGPAAIAGLLIGFAGILVLVWPELHVGGAGAHAFLAGVVAIEIAGAGWALGSSYAKRHSSHGNVLGTTAVQMLLGGLMMVAAGTVRGEWRSLWFSARSGWALAYLSTVGSVGGFVAYTYALRRLPVSFVSLYAFINPIIAVTLGVLFLREPFTSRMAVAAVLVLGGVAIVRFLKLPPRGPVARPAHGPGALPERRNAV